MASPHILHHGAKDGVTGPSHQLLMAAEHGHFIYCGLFHGVQTSVKGKSFADRLVIELPLAMIQALVATHVNSDLVGHIPYLPEAGPKGPILCGGPSAKLLPIVLEDTFSWVSVVIQSRASAT
tara:strand:- start:16716 stop:17084 length:369 start_codon:yes stop_codon:yes gene_type:complete